ncbi:MAG: PD-(D/E)XK nuclease family protein [Bacteroidales bacterium]|nr:PD-(D/E)XK nuclease family protein [Bacteroidales bacterium]
MQQPGQNAREISVEKTHDILVKLKAHLAKGISPSALNKFLDCSLKYYLRYISGIKEPETFTAEMDFKSFGDVFHASAENLYRPFIDKTLTKESLQGLLKESALIEKAILRAFAEKFFHVNEIDIHKITGKNKILYEVVFRYLTRLVDTDIGSAPITILGLEQEVKANWFIEADERLPVVLKGNIDRIDSTGEGLRLIDYKTGSEKTPIKTIDELFDGEKGLKRNSAVFQVLLYGLMYHLAFEKNSVPYLLYLRGMFRAGQDGGLGRGTTYFDFAEAFTGKLTQLFNNMLDPKQPFLQTTDINLCRYCGYNSLCKR